MQAESLNWLQRLVPFIDLGFAINLRNWWLYFILVWKIWSFHVMLFNALVCLSQIFVFLFDYSRSVFSMRFIYVDEFSFILLLILELNFFVFIIQLVFQRLKAKFLFFFVNKCVFKVLKLRILIGKHSSIL